MSTVNPGAGVIIARFQVSDLTRAHDELLHRVARLHDKVVVLLGVHPKLSTKENPLSFESRERMLRVHWADTVGKNTNKQLLIAPLPDRATDVAWSKQVDFLLDSLLGPMISKTLYGGRRSFIPHYSGRFNVNDLSEASEPLNYDQSSGSEHRAILHTRPPITEEGRAGAIWATGNQWPRVDPCVDMAVVRDRTGHPLSEVPQVLMGRKYSASGLYCFPGGHIDHEDKSAEHAASREFLEETGVQIDVSQWKYVCQLPVNDWRNVPSQQTWSTLYTTEDEPERFVANDDLDSLEWVDLDVSLSKVSVAHVEMFKRIKKWYNVA